MKVRVLGSSSGEPVINRNASSYLIQSGNSQILVDAGDGVSRQLLNYKLDAAQIDSVMITHTHPDHVGGLFLLLQQMFISKREKRLSLFLPPGGSFRFQQILNWFNLNTNQWPFSCEIKPLPVNSVLELDDIQIEAVQNGHLKPDKINREDHLYPESFSLIFYDSKQRKMIYTSDIDDIEVLNSSASMVDVLLSECTHIDPQDVIQFSITHSIKRLIFTHIPPDRQSLNCSDSINPVNIKFVNDGDEFEV